MKNNMIKVITIVILIIVVAFVVFIKNRDKKEISMEEIVLKEPQNKFDISESIKESNTEAVEQPKESQKISKQQKQISEKPRVKKPKIEKSEIVEKKVEKKIEKKSGIQVTFIELGSLSCIPCKMMQPIMEEIEKEYTNQVKVVFYDVWTPTGRPYAQDYRIKVIPTQIFLDKDGNEYFRHEGFFPKEELVKILKQKVIE